MADLICPTCRQKLESSLSACPRCNGASGKASNSVTPATLDYQGSSNLDETLDVIPISGVQFAPLPTWVLTMRSISYFLFAFGALGIAFFAFLPWLSEWYVWLALLLLILVAVALFLTAHIVMHQHRRVRIGGKSYELIDESAARNLLVYVRPARLTELQPHSQTRQNDGKSVRADDKPSD